MWLVSNATHFNMFPSNDDCKTMADVEVEVEEPQTGHLKGKGKKEWNKQDEERVFHCLKWSVEGNSRILHE